MNHVIHAGASGPESIVIDRTEMRRTPVEAPNGIGMLAVIHAVRVKRGVLLTSVILVIVPPPDDPEPPASAAVPVPDPEPRPHLPSAYVESVDPLTGERFRRLRDGEWAPDPTPAKPPTEMQEFGRRVDLEQLWQRRSWRARCIVEPCLN